MINDNHIHINGDMTLKQTDKYFNQYIEKYNIERISLLSIPTFCDRCNILGNLKTLVLKDMMYPEAFAYMGLWHDLSTKASAEDYLKQLEDGIEMGFEGFKMLEGKPDRRRELGLKLNDPVLYKVYSKLEKEKIPIVMHVADPDGNWDRTKCSSYGIAHGWCYDDPTYVTKAELYSEVDEVLNKFPELNLVLAHFYFYSEQLDKAAYFLDSHPTVSFDITPGIEMYSAFSKNHNDARAFFQKYSDRIFLGTDINNSIEGINYCSELYPLILTFLSGNEPFVGLNRNLLPLHLDDDTVKKITYDNFIRLNGNIPKPNNKEKIREEYKKIINLKKHYNDTAEDYKEIEEYCDV